MKERSERLMDVMRHLTQIIASPDVERLCPEAIERYEHLLHRGSIVYPIKEGDDIFFEWLSPISLMDYEGRRAEWWRDLKVYPFLPEDALLGPAAEYMTKTGFAAYGASCHYIIFNVNSYETDRFMATAILHEVGHAQRAEKEKRMFCPAKRTRDERMREELGLWTFDCRLLSAIGGKEFSDATDACVSTIHRLTENAPLVRIQFGPSFGAPLDHCYGHSPDKRSIENRRNTYATYCFFAFADRYIKDDEQRLSFLLRLMDGIHRKEMTKEEKTLRRL